uniref:Uncharacterized protein n=1 Tax=Aegilops tauschii TaxID=37682 RepID=M8BPT0_AEGTA
MAFEQTPAKRGDRHRRRRQWGRGYLVADGSWVHGVVLQGKRVHGWWLQTSDNAQVAARESVWLDRETGAKCYMLSARNLSIVWGDTPQYWTWIPLEDSRFSEGAQLRHVCWLEIRGKIHSNMLSQDTTYATYMVFKKTDDLYGLAFPVQEASVSVGATNLTRKVCLQHNNDDDDDDNDDDDDYDDCGMPENYWSMRRNGLHKENVALPQQRTDGWMELELGEFFNEGGDDGEVSISLTETKGGNWKSRALRSDVRNQAE